MTVGVIVVIVVVVDVVLVVVAVVVLILSTYCPSKKENSKTVLMRLIIDRRTD